MHHICVPVDLKGSVKRELTNLSVPFKNIFSEDFKLIKHPKAYENILTRDINLKFDSSECALEVIKGKSILEAALDACLKLLYSQIDNC